MPLQNFITILSMPALFEHPRIKYMVAPELRKLTFFVASLVVLQNCQFEQLATILEELPWRQPEGGGGHPNWSGGGGEEARPLVLNLLCTTITKAFFY